MTLLTRSAWLGSKFLRLNMGRLAQSPASCISTLAGPRAVTALRMVSLLLCLCLCLCQSWHRDMLPSTTLLLASEHSPVQLTVTPTLTMHHGPRSIQRPMLSGLDRLERTSSSMVTSAMEDKARRRGTWKLEPWESYQRLELDSLTTKLR